MAGGTLGMDGWGTAGGFQVSAWLEPASALPSIGASTALLAGGNAGAGWNTVLSLFAAPECAQQQGVPIKTPSQVRVAVVTHVQSHVRHHQALLQPRRFSPQNKHCMFQVPSEEQQRRQSSRGAVAWKQQPRTLVSAGRLGCCGGLIEQSRMACSEPQYCPEMMACMSSRTKGKQQARMPPRACMRHLQRAKAAMGYAPG